MAGEEQSERSLSPVDGCAERPRDQGLRGHEATRPGDSTPSPRPRSDKPAPHHPTAAPLRASANGVRSAALSADLSRSQGRDNGGGGIRSNVPQPGGRVQAMPGWTHHRRLPAEAPMGVHRSPGDSGAVGASTVTAVADCGLTALVTGSETGGLARFELIDFAAAKPPGVRTQ